MPTLQEFRTRLLKNKGDEGYDTTYRVIHFKLGKSKGKLFRQIEEVKLAFEESILFVLNV